MVLSCSEPLVLPSRSSECFSLSGSQGWAQPCSPTLPESQPADYRRPPKRIACSLWRSLYILSPLRRIRRASSQPHPLFSQQWGQSDGIPPPPQGCIHSYCTIKMLSGDKQPFGAQVEWDRLVHNVGKRGKGGWQKGSEDEGVGCSICRVPCGRLSVESLTIFASHPHLTQIHAQHCRKWELGESPKSSPFSLSLSAHFTRFTLLRNVEQMQCTLRNLRLSKQWNTDGWE